MKHESAHSFVIPAYGESPYLEECIQSLRAQELPSAIHVCTSTPNDHIAALCKRYELPYHVNAGGGSIAADWSFALHTPDTRYVTLAHQDDVYDPRYSALCVEAAERHRDASIVFCDYAELVIRDKQQFIRSSNLVLLVKRCILFAFFLHRSALRGRAQKYWLLAFGSPISCPTVLFNREELGSFAFDEHYRVNLDWAAWRSLAQMSGAFVFLRPRLVFHRIYAESSTSRGLHTRDRQREDSEMFAQFWPTFIAKILSRFYSLAYRSNATDQSSKS